MVKGEPGDQVPNSTNLAKGSSSEVTRQGGLVCLWHLSHTPSPEIIPWVDPVSFLPYKESCVNNWQRKGRRVEFSPALLASQQVSIRQLLAVSSLLLPAASQNSLSSSSIKRDCCCLPCQETPPPGHALPPQPCQINRRHSSVAPSQLLRQTEKS